MDTLDGPLLVHRKVKLVLVSVGSLSPETVEAVLLCMVVACTQYIVLVLFEGTEACSMGELGPLLVCWSMGVHGV